jgi:hypothetical protein
MPDPKPQLSERVNALKTSLGDSETNPVNFERTPQSDGSVVVSLTAGTAGDRISGKGATTADAVADLERKVEAWPK